MNVCIISWSAHNNFSIGHSTVRILTYTVCICTIEIHCYTSFKSNAVHMRTFTKTCLSGVRN